MTHLSKQTAESFGTHGLGRSFQTILEAEEIPLEEQVTLIAVAATAQLNTSIKEVKELLEIKQAKLRVIFDRLNNNG